MELAREVGEGRVEADSEAVQEGHKLMVSLPAGIASAEEVEVEDA